MIKALPIETGKMYFAPDSYIEGRFSILVYPVMRCH